MTEPVYDLVIRGGRVATVSDVFEADVAISGETIVAIGRALPGGPREIDARGKLVLPGGVDSHAHIEQLSAAGIMNADTFETATTSAAFGGTTTVIPFAAQHVGMALPQVVEDYHALAKKGAVIDYTFHMIIADPTRETLDEHVPALVKQGHASIKIFMTYDRLKIEDEPLLDILMAARESGALLCAHAEKGKLRAGPNPSFKQVADGLPGLEVRLPLLFDAMVSKGRLGLEKFVELTATAPAKIYNLHPRKGSIAIGADADIAIWDPDREVTLSDALVHDLTGYTPFAGRILRGWPVTVF